MIGGKTIISITMIVTSWLVTGSAHAGQLKSSTIENFALLRASPSGTRLRAHASFAFVSIAGESMSAANADVEFQVPHRKKRTYQCAVFRYDLHAGFLVCDNRSRVGMKSMTIDANLSLLEIDKR